MNWLQRLARSIVKAGTTPGVDRWFYDWLMDGVETSSGARVNDKTATQAAAVSACVRVVSEDLAKLPLPVYRRLPNGDRERVADHWLAYLLNVRANAIQTSFE